MENLKESCYLAFDKNNEYVVLLWNRYKKYDDFYEEILSEIISKQEYLNMLQEKNKSIDFFIGV
jgi:hypothetical protein